MVELPNGNRNGLGIRIESLKWDGFGTKIWGRIFLSYYYYYYYYYTVSYYFAEQNYRIDRSISTMFNSSAISSG